MTAIRASARSRRRGCGRRCRQLGIRNRLLLVSACFSGVFVPLLASDTTAILTAASADRTSFGCQADQDWTFFGDATINHALRKPQPFAAAAAEATGLIGGWEGQGHLTPSQPQLSVGAGAQALARGAGSRICRPPRPASAVPRPDRWARRPSICARSSDG